MMLIYLVLLLAQVLLATWAYRRHQRNLVTKGVLAAHLLFLFLILLSFVCGPMRFVPTYCVYGALLLKIYWHFRPFAFSVKFKNTMTTAEALRALGLSGQPTKEQIKRAFRDKIRSCHPDHGGSEQQTRHILKAREILLQFFHETR